MSNYTPGPWEWVGSNRLFGGLHGLDEILAAADDGKPYGMHSALIEHHWDSDQAKANASLISAAPDLLEALKAAHHELHYCSQQLVASGWTEGSTVRAALDGASAAIAKALGK